MLPINLAWLLVLLHGSLNTNIFEPRVVIHRPSRSCGSEPNNFACAQHLFATDVRKPRSDPCPTAPRCPTSAMASKSTHTEPSGRQHTDDELAHPGHHHSSSTDTGVMSCPDPSAHKSGTVSNRQASSAAAFAASSPAKVGTKDILDKNGKLSSKSQCDAFFSNAMLTKQVLLCL